MRSIEGHLPEKITKAIDTLPIGRSDGYELRTFRRLVQIIAEIAYLNKDYLLFFRGQDDDYKNKAGSSSFYPTIYRGDYLPQRKVKYRFKILKEASKRLIKRFSKEKITGSEEVKRKKFIQWSILQHYEVCATPLLDFTHSLRVAASFAQLENKNKYAYVYAFGLPYLTNRISTNSEHDLVNVRLLSICPPEAFRPYFQEGYLAGTEDIEDIYVSKTELDFKNRLIAKIRIPVKKSFWGEYFDPIPKIALYPRADRIQKICSEIGEELKKIFTPDRLKSYLKGVD